MEYFARLLPTSCGADFRSCVNTTCNDETLGHTCLPGPVNEYAEGFVKEILSSKGSTYFDDSFFFVNLLANGSSGQLSQQFPPTKCEGE